MIHFRLVFILSAWMLFQWSSPLKSADTSLVSPVEVKSSGFLAEKINLALRRTADQLLRARGDSTSRIPAVEQVDDQSWKVYLNQAIDYALLPSVLQASLDQYGIRQSYEVTVRECETSVIDLGYHQKDFLQDSTIPCGTRIPPEGCHYIQVTFTGKVAVNSFRAYNQMVLFILVGFVGLAGIFGLWKVFRRKNRIGEIPAIEQATSWIQFGLSSLHTSSPVLESGGVRHQLTFREAKLLRLFATHPGELLERDHILQQVWADEGVQVTRSVDVFISRLRKKLAGDPSIGIIAVHGAGYMLEIEPTSD